MSQEISQLRFLICPLKWGLGHFYRVLPIVNYIYNTFHINIYIGADPVFKGIVDGELPFVKFISIPDVAITYSKRNNQIIKLLLQIPRLILSYNKERKFIKNELQKYDIDVIISDNRYGLWSKDKLNIFITHQLHIQISPYLSFFELIASKIIKRLTRQFQHIWIPDFERDFIFSGSLSHPVTRYHKYTFIGILSRFSEQKKMNRTIIDKHKYLFIAILSGPEPQRTIFEKKLLKELATLAEECLIVGGNLNTLASKPFAKNLTYTPYLTTKELFTYINKAKYVICRSGYTSIMDLVICSKKALLIPTPGQTEQEYLAQYLEEKQYFYTQNQKELDISSALNNIEFYSPPSILQKEKYKDEINRLIYESTWNSRNEIR